MTMMMIEDSQAAEGPEDDFLKEMAAVARMITLARQTANDLGADFPTYCLDLALGAVLQVMEQAGAEISPIDRVTWTGPRHMMN